jgi:acetate kinase
MKILILNAGSSTYKFSLYEPNSLSELGEPQAPIWENEIESKDSLKSLLGEMPIAMDEVEAVGHRIVHGGREFQEPVLVTEKVKETIRQYIPLAPLHNPKGLEGIELMETLLPNVPQVAVFDTAFHSTLSRAASTYPGPYEWIHLGIKRYGFHGISYEYCAARCSKLLKKDSLKIVCCHLGNGASIAAIDNNRSVDTTMGFTPLEGLMMGSRSGSIDPGILIYLEQELHQSPEDLFKILNLRSGLQGISGATSDMREILALVAKGKARAILSYDMYIHSLKKNIGAMAAVLDGLDVLIFTAGIGEHAAAVRASACKGLMGIVLDEKKNAENNVEISSSDSKVSVLVIPTKEDWCIAHKIMKMRSHGVI